MEISCWSVVHWSVVALISCPLSLQAASIMLCKFFSSILILSLQLANGHLHFKLANAKNFIVYRNW